MVSEAAHHAAEAEDSEVDHRAAEGSVAVDHLEVVDSAEVDLVDEAALAEAAGVHRAAAVGSKVPVLEIVGTVTVVDSAAVHPVEADLAEAVTGKFRSAYYC